MRTYNAIVPQMISENSLTLSSELLLKQTKSLTRAGKAQAELEGTPQQ